MPDHTPWLRTIIDEPFRDDLRLMFADQLEERGDPQGEFIRAQIRLAALAAGADEPVLANGEPKENLAIRWDIRDCELESLRERARSLLEQHEWEWTTQTLGPEWGATPGHAHHWPHAMGPHTADIVVEYIRGFVDSITLDVGTLLGQPTCPGCVYYSTLRRQQACPQCHGQGTPGIAGQLALATPITEIKLSGSCPASSIGSGGWWYWAKSESASCVGDDLPASLFDALTGGSLSDTEERPVLRYYPTAAEANTVLSRAAVQLCRLEAELPRIEWPDVAKAAKCPSCGGTKLVTLESRPEALNLQRRARCPACA